MNLQASYFRIGNPLRVLDRLLHPFAFEKRVELKGKTLQILWTSRAETEMHNRDAAVVVEMQLYFSCVVKKRVLFHDKLELDKTSINDKLEICFHAVESTSCDPEEFAKNYPVKRDFTSAAAMRMRPSVLKIDFRDGHWLGEFEL